MGGEEMRLFLALNLMLSGLLVTALSMPSTEDNESGDFSIPDGEVMVVRSTDLKKGESYESTTTITYLAENNQSLYLIKCMGKSGTSIIQMKRGDWKPVRHQTIDGEGNIVKQYDFSERSVRVRIPDQKIDKTIEIKGRVYNNSMLTYFLRAFVSSRDSKRVELGLLVDAKRYGLRIVNVYAELVGEETVEVPAGRFHCFKVEFGATGIIGKIFWRTRYHYYFTKDHPHHFVKYSDCEEECIELVQYKIR